MSEYIINMIKYGRPYPPSFTDIMSNFISQIMACLIMAGVFASFYLSFQTYSHLLHNYLEPDGEYDYDSSDDEL